MTKASDNVERLRQGFDALDAGDLATVYEQWHPEAVYCGFTSKGEVELLRGRDAFFGMLAEAFGPMEEVRNELVSVDPVGDEIVVCRVHAIRRPRGEPEPTTFEFTMMLRFEDGLITYGADMVDSAAQSFYRQRAAG